MKIINIEKNEIYPVGQIAKNFIFGAGSLGKALLSTLSDAGVNVTAIWDNDPNKQGKMIEDVPVISFEELSQEGDFNLWIGSNYVNQEAVRIKSLNKVRLYALWRTKNDLKENFQKYEPYFSTYIEGAKEIEAIFSDDYSKKVNHALVEYITEYNANATSHLVSSDEHYFIPEVVLALKKRMYPVIVDCGAFTGELPAYLIRGGVGFGICYCFEMLEENCTVARDNIRALGLEDKVIIEQCGVSDHNTWLYIESKGPNSKIVDYATDNKVQVRKIDSYFANIKVDFIKMDIEGAEMRALTGGISVIKRDRPICAISVYHSLQDRTRIPRYLNSELDNYRFLLRQHSIFSSETVLYAIPSD